MFRVYTRETGSVSAVTLSVISNEIVLGRLSVGLFVFACARHIAYPPRPPPPPRHGEMPRCCLSRSTPRRRCRRGCLLSFYYILFAYVWKPLTSQKYAVEGGNAYPLNGVDSNSVGVGRVHGIPLVFFGGGGEKLDETTQNCVEKILVRLSANRTALTIPVVASTRRIIA